MLKTNYSFENLATMDTFYIQLHKTRVLFRCSFYSIVLSVAKIRVNSIRIEYCLPQYIHPLPKLQFQGKYTTRLT